MCQLSQSIFIKFWTEDKSVKLCVPVCFHLSLICIEGKRSAMQLYLQVFHLN
jgi:hypothetical protein